MPATKIGNDMIWYSKDRKEYEPNHLSRYAKRQINIPVIFFIICSLFDVGVIYWFDATANNIVRIRYKIYVKRNGIIKIWVNNSL